MARVPDNIFEHPRLAAIYDALEADRSDLDVYVAIAEELGARRVLGVGCGTGTFALLLADRGLDVTALDPAGGSLRVARAKAGSERVHWIHGDEILALVARRPGHHDRQCRPGDRRAVGLG